MFKFHFSGKIFLLCLILTVYDIDFSVLEVYCGFPLIVLMKRTKIKTKYPENLTLMITVLKLVHVTPLKLNSNTVVVITRS